ncbi:MAG: hypothetical protein KC613_20435 [Myxococcales bacterium]|nr:hypothetical protein [Myxococcales bacterium]MCB9524066.1 hypothetical protein [Myxococcales bacterium]
MPVLSSAALVAALCSPPTPAHAAVARLQAQQPQVRVTWRGEGPSLITGLRLPTQGADPLARAADFLARHGALLGTADWRPLAVRPQGTRMVVQLAQHHGGHVVLDRGASLTLDAQGDVVALHGARPPLAEVARATIDAAQAVRLATEAVVGHPAPAVAAKATARPVVLAQGAYGAQAYEVRVLDKVVRVDAAAGQVVGVQKGWME